MRPLVPVSAEPRPTALHTARQPEIFRRLQVTHCASTNFH